MSFDIRKIPTIMRNHHWLNAARLMDIWFAKPTSIAPNYGAPDTASIRMDAWVLTFPRARAVYDQLMNDRVWINTAAQAEIGKMLRHKGCIAPISQPFGNLNQTVETHDADYINYRVVSFGVSELDDMSAALGKFTFRVLVSGWLTAGGASGYQVAISEVGIYIRDSYDFQGEQDLGYWDDADNAVSMVNPLSGTGVSNKDFRDWRSKNGRGGDFIVFSDIKRTRLLVPDKFFIK